MTTYIQALNEFLRRMGEVQVSPTAYTILARMKALETLMGAGLPVALTSDKLKVRATEIETLLAGGLPVALDSGALKVKEQSPLTELDVDLTKVGGSAISLTNYLPVGIAYPAGTLIDPRDIRALTNSDVVKTEQSTASSHKVEIHQPSSKETFQILTEGGTNIIIDALLQGAHVERQATISNDGTLVGWLAMTGNNRDGKYFPRGCRGWLESIDVYCRDSGSTGGTITVYLVPYVTGDYILSATVTVPASGAAAWRSASFKAMWHFDSMFIFVVCSTAETQFAYDTTAPWDRKYSLDAAVTWTNAENRNYFRAVMKCLTVGDLPVSGVVGIGFGDRLLVLDHVAPAVPVIEFEHHMVHEEKAYIVSDHDPDVDIAAPKYWHIKTPNTAKRCHIKITVESSLAALIEFFENPTTTNDGTGLTAYNCDRNSTKSSTVSFYYDPTVSADGTKLLVQHVGTYTPRIQVGGVARPGLEWELKQNEQYLLKVTSEGDDALVTVQMDFYEV